MKHVKNSLLVICLISSFFGLSNIPLEEIGLNYSFRKKPIELKAKKTGPYIAWQRGKYNVGEFGFERQYKSTSLKKTTTNAFHMGFNYNFKQNVLGYDIGYWRQQGQLGFTFGGNLVLRTNFDETRVGIAPVVGFKLFQFHLQTGYHFLTPARNFDNTNFFFVSLRFVLVKDREYDMKGKKGGLFSRDKKDKKTGIFN